MLRFIDRAKALRIDSCSRDPSQLSPAEAFDLGSRELQILSSRTSFLNDICMNGLPKLLQALFARDLRHQVSSSKCAIFSTYDLNRIRYRASDAELWRNTRRLKFWEKDVWIIPIHRPQERHWVLAVLYLQFKEVHVFDSLAGKLSWHSDIEVFLVRNQSK